MSMKKNIFLSLFGVIEWIEIYKSDSIEIMIKIKFGDDVLFYIWVLKILYGFFDNDDVVL